MWGLTFSPPKKMHINNDFVEIAIGIGQILQQIGKEHGLKKKTAVWCGWLEETSRL